MSDRFGERIRAFNVLFNPSCPQAWADGATELIDQYFRDRQQYEPEAGLRRPIEALERAVAEGGLHPLHVRLAGTAGDDRRRPRSLLVPAPRSGTPCTWPDAAESEVKVLSPRRLRRWHAAVGFPRSRAAEQADRQLKGRSLK